jgi:transposase InsO family protein
MTCHPHSFEGHGYIIVAVDYFTKWAEAMPTFNNTGRTIALFIFNHIIARLGVPQAIVTNHGSHFRNFMMSELTEKLGLRHENSTPYYPQANGQVEEINKILITMLRRMIGIHKTSWHTMFFSSCWAYQTSVKSATEFTPFQLVYGLEAILSIECDTLPKTSRRTSPKHLCRRRMSVVSHAIRRNPSRRHPSYRSPE